MTHGRAILFLPMPDWDGSGYHFDYASRWKYDCVSKWHKHRVFCRTLNSTRANWTVRYRFFKSCCVAIFRWEGTR